MLSTGHVNLDHLAKVVFARCLHCKGPPLPSHAVVLFGVKLLSAAQLMVGRGEGLSSTSWGGVYINYLEYFCTGELSLFPYVFTQSFICISVN